MSTQSPNLMELAFNLDRWAYAYRSSSQYRFPSDPHAEFFPVDMENAANELRKAAAPDVDIDLLEVAHRLDRAMEDETISCLQAAKEMSAALRKAAAPEVQAAQVNLTPPMGINVGWQTIRNVLEAVHPGWEPTHNSDPDPTWDFAKALIEGYIASTYRECLHCNKSFDPYFLYRCWDCGASVCKNCVGLHMGPSHKPHAQSSPVAPEGQMCDIRTAPRDGTRILLGDENGNIFPGYWSTGVCRICLGSGIVWGEDETGVVCARCNGTGSIATQPQSSPVVPDQHAGANVSDGDELLPCPFCGSGAKPETGRYGFKSIVCTTCCAETASATSDEQASTWWNRRSIQQQATDAPAEGTSVGEITWHSSEDGGGPDVGISLYLGPNDCLYAGEISSDLFRQCGGEEFYPSDGGWFLVRFAEETSIIASIGDQFSGRDFLEQLAQWARASAPKPAPAVDREALINAIKSKIHANKGFEFPVIEGIDEAADAIFELLPATPDQTTEGQP